MIPLQSILDRVREVAAGGKLPVVAFDIDSTVVHTGERHRRILTEFAATHGDPALEELARNVSAADFGWSVLDPVKKAGLNDPVLHDAIMKVWSRGFFSNRFAKLDLPVRGAVPFAQTVAGAGGLCVYLTGRDAPGMSAGTLRLLLHNRFPLVDGHGMVMMKRSTRAQDADHKTDAVQRLKELGQVVATFENEPAHANAFYELLPGATHVLVGGVHSPGAPEPDTALVRVPDFRGPWERT